MSEVPQKGYTQKEPDRPAQSVPTAAPDTLSKAKTPLRGAKILSADPYSVAAFTSPKAKAEDSLPSVAPEKLAADHFAENDLQEEWQHFLKNLYARDPITHLAIRDFKLKKTGENEVTIQYPSDTARREFDKVSPQFLADFRVKTNNYLVNFHFVQDTQALRREVVTKKQIFADLVKVNPLLAELDAFLKFDLND